MVIILNGIMRVWDYLFFIFLNSRKNISREEFIEERVIEIWRFLECNI